MQSSTADYMYIKILYTESTRKLGVGASQTLDVKTERLGTYWTSI